MSKEMKRIAEENSLTEVKPFVEVKKDISTKTESFKDTAKATSTMKISSDEGTYSGPCRICDTIIHVPIKNGKKECTACKAVF